MKLISWNVNGIRAMMKKQFTESLATIQADVVCLQETKASNAQVALALADLRGYHLYSNESKGKKGYSGTAVLTRTRPSAVSYDMATEAHDQEGRVITLEYAHLFLVNVYVPNAGQELARLEYRQQWDADFLRYLEGLQQQKPVVVCGDFNVAHQPIDLARPQANYNKSAGYTQAEIDGFSRLLERGWVDTFRHLYPKTVAYSWWSFRMNARARNIGWRIDYCLVSRELTPRVQDAFVLPQYTGSDHCPVGMVLQP